MKIYIASAYARREAMAAYQATLRNMGFECTARWVDGLYADVDTSKMNNAAFETFQAGCAAADLYDMDISDMIICFTHDTIGGSGHHVEVGYCLGRDRSAVRKQVVIVGPRLNVFHYANGVRHFETFEQLVDWIVRYVEVPA